MGARGHSIVGFPIDSFPECRILAGGTCNGDSGGPVFHGGYSSNLIVAVTSFGLNVLCRGTDFSYRVDQADVLAWLAEHMH